MKPLATIHVLPDLPAPLAPLWDLSYNLWWSWSTEVLELFFDIDPEVWFESGRNPLRFLASLSQDRLAAAEANGELAARIARLTSAFEEYVSRKTWFDERYGENGLQIAYFSLEFGIARSLPIYSGGLGVLAGDHLKSASNLGLPLAGVGLLYRQGYFRQTLNPDGWQLETYPENDFDRLPVQPVTDSSGAALTVEVPYPHGAVAARIWRADVDREGLGLTREQLLGLGRADPGDHDSDFCMTVLALRLSAQANGVSRLHGKVARSMWGHLWPDLAPSEVPIAAIANGVHSQTWASPQMAGLLDREAGSLPGASPPTAERTWRRFAGSPTESCGRSARSAASACSTSRGVTCGVSSGARASPRPRRSDPCKGWTTASSPSVSPAASPPTSAAPCC